MPQARAEAEPLASLAVLVWQPEDCHLPHLRPPRGLQMEPWAQQELQPPVAPQGTGRPHLLKWVGWVSPEVLSGPGQLALEMPVPGSLWVPASAQQVPGSVPGLPSLLLVPLVSLSPVLGRLAQQRLPGLAELGQR